MQKRFTFTVTFLVLILGQIFFFQNCGEGFNAINLPQSSLNINNAKIVSCETSQPPMLLSATCQKRVDGDLEQFDNLSLFEPQYPLFSDSADKRRWIYIPQFQQINTSNADEWVFPQGTILWKEFSLNGRKVETRMLEKIDGGIGLQSWRASVYLWRADQSDAELLTGNFENLLPVDAARYEADRVRNVYSVLNATQCNACHQGARDASLGFGYLQLSHLGSRADSTLDHFKAMNRLSHPPAQYDMIPGPPEAQKAIGYIQSNCASCHNPRGRAPSGANFLHLSTALTLADENLVKSNLNQGGSYFLAGDPESSLIYTRLIQGTMPPRGSVPLKQVDEVGSTLLRNWILGLQ